jgi:ribosomal protein S18 acetylase RimI-like enzyme
VAADFIVRLARPSDAGAIASVHVEAWRAGYRGLLADDALAQLSVGERERSWRRLLADEQARRRGRRVDVAVSADPVVGFVAAGPSRESDGSALSGEVYALYVHPDHWSSGVGSALLDTALAHMRGLGMREALLWVLAENARARRFYELAGWTWDGRSKTERLAAISDFAGEVEEVSYRRDIGGADR